MNMRSPAEVEQETPCRHTLQLHDAGEAHALVPAQELEQRHFLEEFGIADHGTQDYAESPTIKES
jgi:hypothetical protein